MALVDEISPSYVGEDRIGLSLADPNQPIYVNTPIQVNIDYSGAAPEGLVLPLELSLSGPTEGQYQRTLYTTSKPAAVVLVPRVKGQHFILLRERFHNRWQGRLLVDVLGDDMELGDERAY